MANIQKKVIYTILFSLILLEVANADIGYEGAYYNVNVNTASALYNTTISGCDYAWYDSCGNDKIVVLCNGSKDTTNIVTIKSYTIADSIVLSNTSATIVLKANYLNSFYCIGDYVYIIGEKNAAEGLSKWDFSGNLIWRMNTTNSTYYYRQYNASSDSYVDGEEYNATLFNTNYKVRATAKDSGGIAIATSTYTGNACGGRVFYIDTDGDVKSLTSWKQVSACGAETYIPETLKIDGEYIVARVYNGYASGGGVFYVMNKNGGTDKGGMTVCGACTGTRDARENAGDCFFDGDPAMVSMPNTPFNDSWSSDVFCYYNTQKQADFSYEYTVGAPRIWTNVGYFPNWDNAEFMNGSYATVNEATDFTQATNDIYGLNDTYLSIRTTTLGVFTQEEMPIVYTGGVIITPDYLILNSINNDNMSIYDADTLTHIKSYKLTGTARHPTFTTDGSKDFLVVFADVGSDSVLWWSEGIESAQVNESEKVNVTFSVRDALDIIPPFSYLESVIIGVSSSETGYGIGSYTTNISGEVTIELLSNVYYNFTYSKSGYYTDTDELYFSTTQKYYKVLLPTSSGVFQGYINVSTNVSGTIQQSIVRMYYQYPSGETGYTDIDTGVEGWTIVPIPLFSNLEFASYQHALSITSCKINGEYTSYCSFFYVYNHTNVSVEYDEYVDVCFDVATTSGDLLQNGVTLILEYNCNESYQDCEQYMTLSDGMYSASFGETDYTIPLPKNNRMRVLAYKDGYAQTEGSINFDVSETGYCIGVFMYENYSDGYCSLLINMRPYDSTHEFNWDEVDRLRWNIYLGTVENYTPGEYEFTPQFTSALTCDVDKFNNGYCSIGNFPFVKDSFVAISVKENPYYNSGFDTFKCVKQGQVVQLFLTLEDGGGGRGTPSYNTNNTAVGGEFGLYESDFSENVLPLMYDLLTLIIILGLLMGLLKILSGE